MAKIDGRGRPRKDGKKQSFREGKLHAVLAGAFPDHVKEGRVDVDGLAEHLGVARFTLYQRLNKDKLIPEAAAALVEKSEGRLSREVVSQFVF